MKRLSACFALGFALATAGSAALAANSTNGPPPNADKEGGIAGDPHGAIRALGGTGQTDFKKEGDVTIPNLGNGPGTGSVDGTPPGTTGPR